VRLSEEELAGHDVAEMNLTCAVGLPGVGVVDAELCLFKLDYWARCIRQYTERMLPQFHRKRYDYENSERVFA
jgi:hypothetical protein